MALRFHSQYLDKVIKKVRTQHSSRAGEGAVIAGSVVDEVRKILDACPDEALAQTAFQFRLKQILACIEIIGTDKKGRTADKAAMIVIVRPRSQAIAKGWYRLVKSYPNDMLENVVRKLIEIKGFSILENRKDVSPDVPFWFVSGKLAQGIVREFQKKEQTGLLDDYLANNYFRSEDGLFKEVWRVFLLEGTPHRIAKEGSSRLLREFEHITNRPYVEKFGQYYLNRLSPTREWDSLILDFIYQRYGLPKDEENTGKAVSMFWSMVNDHAKQEFRKWAILKQVETFFEGERADFWRRFVKSSKVVDVQQILEGSGFMLDFGKFGVIEFKDKGNASYIYPVTVFQEYWSGAKFRANNPTHFKDITKTLVSAVRPSWKGRILHHRGWQDTAENIIRNLMR